MRIKTVFLALAACAVMGEVLADSTEQTVGLFLDTPESYQGYTLFSPQNYTTTYLIDDAGLLVHEWPSDGQPRLMAYLLRNGHLLRAEPVPNSAFFGFGCAGGKLKELDWDGNTTWTYVYSNDQHLQHHDIERMPNGNTLLIAWEKKTTSESIAAGRKPELVTYLGLWPDHIIEVHPTGPNSGTIVWEWHLWDHLIQDYDPTKANYGVVADHPELVDINFADQGSSYDWNHSNSIRFNPTYDEIMISVRYFSEFWVIDHSTTTAQAAGHTGGRHGKGGDLLYRWGNPRAYQRGTLADQKLFYQHDAQWITSGLPGAGDILIFNNGNGRPGGSYSSIDQITPPVDANGDYTIEPGQPFGPSTLTWSYAAKPHGSFYADRESGAQRLPNGNTLICDMPADTFFEVNSAGETVWKYVNPVGTTGPVPQGSLPDFPGTFKVRRYSASYPGLAGRDLNPGCTVETGTTCTMTASFSVSPPVPADAAPVTFTAIASGGTLPYSYAWDLGGEAASGFTVSRSFEAGSYMIYLTVTDAMGLVATANQPLTVAPSVVPPPVSDGKSSGTPAIFGRNIAVPGMIDVAFDAVSCSSPKAVILYGALGDYTGYTGCAQADAGNTGSATIDASGLANVWFNIIWTTGTTGGHPGFARAESGDVPRTWPAAPLCGLTADDHNRETCP